MAIDQASTAADGANRRETEYIDSTKSDAMPAGKANSQHDLREALNEWDANDQENDPASRAADAAEQSAAMELELERNARGNADLGITSVLDAVAAGEGDKRKVLYSFLSEDYREGGTSDYNKNDYYIRHQGERVAVTTFSGGVDRQDATFKLVSALCTPGQGACPNQNSGSSGCISIESVNWQSHFLVQHEKGELSFAKGDGSDGFAAAATFCLKPGLANSGTGVTMEPLGEPQQYLLHEGYHMVVGSVEGAAARGSPLSATFRLRSGLFMGFCAGPEKPTACTCLGGFLGDSCAQPCPGLEVMTDGTVEVCSNQGDCTLGDKKEAICICQEGFLGKECNLLCPRSNQPANASADSLEKIAQFHVLVLVETSAPALITASANWTRVEWVRNVPVTMASKAMIVSLHAREIRLTTYVPTMVNARLLETWTQSAAANQDGLAKPVISSVLPTRLATPAPTMENVLSRTTRHIATVREALWA